MKIVYQILSVLTIGCSLIGCSFAKKNSSEKEDITFYSRDTKLSGTIVFPKNEPIHAVVVFVHGSGKSRQVLLDLKVNKMRKNNCLIRGDGGRTIPITIGTPPTF